MVLFKHAGRANTKEVVRLAVARAMELDCDIVAASTFGVTADALQTEAEAVGFKNKIVIVRGVPSKGRKGKNLMPDEQKEKILSRGGVVMNAAHGLSAGERGLSGKFKGISPLEIMAETLRLLGQGIKVGVEISMMALEAEHIEFGKPVVAIGGTHRGADAAIVVTPCYSASILDNVVHEIICKPYDLKPPTAAELTDWPEEGKIE